MCNDQTEELLFSIINGTDELFNLPDDQLVREFMEIASLQFPFFQRGAYYDLEYTPPWIEEDLLNYSIYGLSALKV